MHALMLSGMIGNLRKRITVRLVVVAVEHRWKTHTATPSVCLQSVNSVAV